MKKLLVAAVLFAIASACLWAQFYERFSPQERKVLAEAYYLVSQQYAQVGEKAKALEFEQMAYNINPGLDPSQIREEEQPSAAAIILAGKARLAVSPVEREQATQELIKSRFLRFVSALLTEDTQSMLDLMDGSVYFTKLGLEMDQPAIRSQLDGFFESVSLAGLVPTEVYDIGSLTVSPVAEASSRGWGESYAVNIRAKMDFSKQVVFWEQDQRYLMHLSGQRWLMFSIGQGLPPAGWKPKPAAIAAKAAAVPEAGPEPEIRQNLLAALDHFLRKQVDEASRYFARQVQILRLDTTLSREEIAATFQGYFEASDFSGVDSEDILDAQSIFIERTDRFADQRRGDAYRLTVKTRIDLSDRIPFWTRFQDYYFAQEEGNWRIFAIF